MQLHDRHTLIEEGVCAQVWRLESGGGRRRARTLAAQTETGNELARRAGERGVFVTGYDIYGLTFVRCQRFPANLWQRRSHIGVRERASTCRSAESETLKLKAPIISFFPPSAAGDVSSDVGEKRERETEEMSLLRSKF